MPKSLMGEGTTGTNPTLSAKHTLILTARRLYVTERALRLKPYRAQVASQRPGSGLVG
jgi:hypothetical protein